MPNINKAREWAEGDFDQAYIHAGPRAAAEVIQSLPDTVVDGDKLREVIADWGNREVTSDAYTLYRQVLALLPAPSLPTLADMTPEEREACQWMQAKIHRSDDLVGVIFFVTDDRAKIMFRDGTFVTQGHKDITPLPGESKMEWPGDGVVDAPVVDGEPTLSRPEEVKPGDYRLDSHMGNSVITALPRPEEVPVGEPWIVQHQDGEGFGFRNDPGTGLPWLVIGKGHQEFNYCSDVDIALVSRLVPEVAGE